MAAYFRFTDTDGRPRFVIVEDHLDEACGAFLPGCHWCPWSSRLVDEVKPG